MDRTPRPQPSLVSPGVPIVARELNGSLSQAHADSLLIRRGDLNEFPLSLVPAEWIAECRISRVEPAEFDDNLPPFPEDVYYWIFEKGVPDAKLDRVQPVYGRPASGRVVRIMPAQVGETCFMVRIPTDQGGFRGLMMVLTEQIAWRRCNGGGIPPPPPPPAPSPFPPSTFPYAPPRNTDPGTTPIVPVY